jgi:hypothetical protein
MKSRLTLILAAILTLYLMPEKSPQCDCRVLGADSNDEYFSIPGDREFPEPAVVKISDKIGHPAIWIKYYEPGAKGNKAVTYFLKSENGGRSWIRDLQPQNSQELNSEESQIIYKANTADLLDSSRDGGRHWTSSRFDVDGMSAVQFARKIGNNTPATLHFGLAGINPQNRANIYGSFSVWVPSQSDLDIQVKTIDLPGIYVSYDAGDDWAMFAPNLRGNTPNETARLGIDPSDPKRMIGHGLSGLVITIDGGKSWSPVGQQTELESPADIRGRKEGLASRGASGADLPLHPKFAYLTVRQIAFQPGDGNIIYVVSNKGLFKSADGARSWCLVFSGDHRLFELNSLIFDPGQPNRLYIGGRNSIWISEDRGCSFNKFFDWGEYLKSIKNPNPPLKN